MNALERAIEKAGSQSALARAIGGKTKQQHVSYWLRESKGVVPPTYCEAIELATGVPRHELRPDLWAPPKKKERVQQ